MLEAWKIYAIDWVTQQNQNNPHGIMNESHQCYGEWTELDKKRVATWFRLHDILEHAKLSYVSRNQILVWGEKE